jgi:hypothetical protein
MPPEFGAECFESDARNEAHRLEAESITVDSQTPLRSLAAKETRAIVAAVPRTEAPERRGTDESTRGQRRGIQASSLGTSERRQAKIDQNQRLENLGQLAGGIAHDFNNLLSVILNYASFAAEDLSDASDSDWGSRVASAQSDLAQVTLAAERASGLTRQLLAFARQEVIRPQVLDLDQVISTVEELLKLTLGENVQVITSLAGQLWPVLADPGQLQRVLVNLAMNARDAMPEGGTLSIDTCNLDVDADAIAGGSKARAGRNVRVRMSDTGTGMTADVAEHVFEPFFTTKDVDGGTGLGLSTVYGILAQAGGQIQIQSAIGSGTTVSITLPVTAEAAEAASLRSDPPTVLRTPKGETVLVVEDQDALREVTRRILARNGYVVLTAANGHDALETARDHLGEIHLLVTDVVMPLMLGKEVAEKMLEIVPGLEVLFMSGYARPVLASQGRLDTNVALVEKPFSEAELLKQVGLVLDGHFRGYVTIDETPS